MIIICGEILDFLAHWACKGQGVSRVRYCSSMISPSFEGVALTGSRGSPIQLPGPTKLGGCQSLGINRPCIRGIIVKGLTQKQKGILY